MVFGFYRPKSSLVVVERPCSEVLLVLKGLKVSAFLTFFVASVLVPSTELIRLQGSLVKSVGEKGCGLNARGVHECFVRCVEFGVVRGGLQGRFPLCLSHPLFALSLVVHPAGPASSPEKIVRNNAPSAEITSGRWSMSSIMCSLAGAQFAHVSRRHLNTPAGVPCSSLRG